MDNQYPYTTSPEERARRRAQRIAARKKREWRRRKRMLLCLAPLLALAVVMTVALISGSDREDTDTQGDSAVDGEDTIPVFTPAAPLPAQEPEPEPPYSVSSNADTAWISVDLPSQYAILVDLNSDTIIAQKNAQAVVSPASMTKILTVLVAAEAIENESQLDDTVVIDFDITNYCYINDCSVAGFLKDEAVPVRELFYGTILPSGADAALALAEYVAGSQEEFVVLMNEKVDELGLSDTAHFTNCIGLYDEENVCTVYDMAMILKAALDNDLARQALTTKVYEIPANEHHEEGIVLSNWFLRRIEDHILDGVEVLGAKTGYVSQSGNCAASYAENTDGGRFICVTADSTSSWQCIFDHVAIYEQFAGVESE